MELIAKKFEGEMEKEKGEIQKSWDDKEKLVHDEDEAKLMKLHKEKVLKEEEILQWKDHHNAIYESMTAGYKTVSEEETCINEGFRREDPTIPTRNQIKEMSAKIVEKMSKRED